MKECKIHSTSTESAVLFSGTGGYNFLSVLKLSMSQARICLRFAEKMIHNHNLVLGKTENILHVFGTIKLLLVQLKL